jgi:hypothetical protein
MEEAVRWAKDAHARAGWAWDVIMLLLLLLLLLYAQEMRPQGEHFPQSNLADCSKSSLAQSIAFKHGDDNHP